jgi:hypothetical protein
MKNGEAVKKRARAAVEGKIAKGPAGYREIGCAVLGFCDEDGKLISAVRLAKMPEAHKASLKELLRVELDMAMLLRPDLRLVKAADTAPQKKVVQTELAYFRKYQKRMRYAEMKAEGMPIGTGVTEDACKMLVTQRLKQSGMRWSQDGGQAILNLRGWAQS